MEQFIISIPFIEAHNLIAWAEKSLGQLICFGKPKNKKEKEFHQRFNGAIRISLNTLYKNVQQQCTMSLILTNHGSCLLWVVQPVSRKLSCMEVVQCSYNEKAIDLINMLSYQLSNLNKSFPHKPHYIIRFPLPPNI